MPRIRSQGTTLIEMLVVLVIMALLAALTTLGLGVSGSGNTQAQADTVAENLVRVFTHAESAAALRSEAVRWSLAASTGEADAWWYWTGSADNAGQQSWQPWPDAPTSAVDVPAGLRIELSDTMPLQQQDQPSVMFIPAQGVVPFELWIRETNDGRLLARVWSTEGGAVQWESH